MAYIRSFIFQHNTFFWEVIDGSQVWVILINDASRHDWGVHNELMCTKWLKYDNLSFSTTRFSGRVLMALRCWPTSLLLTRTSCKERPRKCTILSRTLRTRDAVTSACTSTDTEMADRDQSEWFTPSAFVTLS